jgi:putative heme-binding domain-containing protein
VAGNAERGAQVFAKAGCAGCHVVRGAGTALGPELSDIGARRTAASLRRAVTNPDESVAEGFTLVEVRTTQGRAMRGLRLNEDSFTIQLKSEGGQFHSLRKIQLTKLDKQFGRSLMPNYEKSLAAPDLDDLVAYLASLRGEE